jgi:hypothetical protein
MTRRTVGEVLVATLVMGAIAEGCALVAGLGDFKDATSTSSGSGGTGGTGGSGGSSSASGGSSSSGSSSSSGTGGGNMCPDTDVCAPAPPGGWNGPVQISGDSCSETSMSVAVVGDQVIGSAPNCGCGRPPNAPSCDVPSFQRAGSPGCSNAFADKATLGCTSSNGTPFTALGDGPATPPLANCAPAPLPPVEYGLTSTLCARIDPIACGEGTCLAKDNGPACIWMNSQTECMDPYPVKTSLVRGTFLCTCGPVMYDCDGETQFFDNPLCSGAPGETLQHPQACYTFVNSAQTMKFVPSNAAAFTGLCADEVAEIALEMITVCCTQP